MNRALTDGFSNDKVSLSTGTVSLETVNPCVSRKHVLTGPCSGVGPVEHAPNNHGVGPDYLGMAQWNNLYLSLLKWYWYEKSNEINFTITTVVALRT